MFGIVSATSIPQFPAKDRETNLSTQQEDPELLEVITFLFEGKCEKKAKELALTKTQYEIVEDVLYHIVTVESYYCLVISTGANFLGLFQLCIFCLEF